jgi:hypothetical protein
VRGSHVAAGLAMILALAGCVDVTHERIHHTGRGNGSAAPPTADLAKASHPPSVVLTLHAKGTEDEHDRYWFTMPSTGDNGQAGNVVTGWYFQRGQGRAPLVIVVPIYGSSAYPSWTVARFLASQPAPLGINVVLVEAERDLIDWNRLRLATSEEAWQTTLVESTARYRTVAADISRIIDWAVTRPTTDPTRLGIVGFSISATIAAVAMAADDRLTAGAFLMGGAHLHEVFAFCRESQVTRVRNTTMRRFGWNLDTFKDKIQPLADSVNPALMPSLNGDRHTLYVEATDDDCIPKTARDGLRDMLTPSETIQLGYRHWPSFLFGMTPLGLHYLERAVVRFFVATFGL